MTESVDTYNNTADYEFRHVGHGFNQGVIYFLIVRIFDGTGGYIAYGRKASTVLPYTDYCETVHYFTAQFADLCTQILHKSDNNCGKYDKHLRLAIWSGILRRFSLRPHSINFLDVYLPELYRNSNKSLKITVKISFTP